MSNIKNNNYRKIDCRLIDDEYMDFMLSKDEVYTNIDTNTCLGSKLTFNDKNNRHVVSDTSWSNAVESDDILNNIGFTGVDNGFIVYQRDRINNDEFLDLYTNSIFKLSTFKNKFFVTEVNGNTQQLLYPIEKYDDYTALKGGFYQGFFKIHGGQYQTLPHEIETEWNFNITLRPQNYQVSSKTLNMRHPNNRGMFFYIGTRAENKFWELYKHDSNMENLNINGDNYCSDFDLTDTNVTYCQYNSNGESFCDNVFADDYITETPTLQKIELSDSKGHDIKEKGFYEIETDNKFIIFNNGKNGENKNTWNDSFEYVLTGKTDTPNINYFPYLNQTASGYTKNNIDHLIEKYQYNYDVFTEIQNNAFGIKINDDGSLSYKYLVSTCETDRQYDIKEETTKPNIITPNEWNNVHIKFTVISDNKMKVSLYINGYLKFVSQELPLLKLSPLRDTPERQEGVPFNISIGGGTQGLAERIYLDYYDITDYMLPLEKHFAGTFIGDIKDFSFYDCHLSYQSISQLGSGF